jgi:transposase-like protein
MPRLSVEQRELIKRLAGGGATLAAAARASGAGKEAVRRVVVGGPAPPELRAEAARLRREGLTVAEVARRTGLPPQAVRAYSERADDLAHLGDPDALARRAAAVRERALEAMAAGAAGGRSEWDALTPAGACRRIRRLWRSPERLAILGVRPCAEGQNLSAPE